MEPEQQNNGRTEFNYESIVTETDDAIMFDIYGDGITPAVWIPKSAMDHDPEKQTFTISDTLAIKKELI